MSQYPESDKLRDVAQEWDAIVEFFDSIPYSLAHHKGYYLEYADETVESLLYKHFRIDPIALEKERRAMLDGLRDLI